MPIYYVSKKFYDLSYDVLHKNLKKELTKNIDNLKILNDIESVEESSEVFKKMINLNKRILLQTPFENSLITHSFRENRLVSEDVIEYLLKDKKYNEITKILSLLSMQIFLSREIFPNNHKNPASTNNELARIYNILSKNLKT